ncbi:MAG: enoyl-CoA hydratase [Proteobacteria bacterium]|nr:MAG: enoyl-CoA hydratase [Pseudomonadota bacterium]
MYEEILYEVADPVATITLHRPAQLNAWTDRMAAEVKHALAAAESDRRVVVIVLTGAGRGFCAGADLQRLKAITEGERGMQAPPELADADPGDPSVGASFRGNYTYLMSIRKPVVAAINGACAGMAMPIALSCDVRFASDRAVFTTAFSRRGLIAEWGLSWLLPRLVGPAHALDLCFSARKVDAAEAERIGLVNRVFPHDELLARTREWAEEVAANCSPTSMRIMKRQVYQHLTETLAHAEQEAVRLMVESFDRPDFREGVLSFLEKRAPKFERV